VMRSSQLCKKKAVEMSNINSIFFMVSFIKIFIL